MLDIKLDLLTPQQQSRRREAQNETTHVCRAGRNIRRQIEVEILPVLSRVTQTDLTTSS